LLLAPVLGCGTILYPEPADGVVPGLVAFAVDFTTGAIYLPPGVTAPGELALGSRDPRELETVLRETAGIDLGAHWDQVVVLRDCAREASPEIQVAELDAAARTGLPAFAGCSR
jgi:hypothetical protein